MPTTAPAASAATSDQPVTPAILYPVPDAARLLGISERTLHSLTKAETIRAKRVGRRVLYRLADLEAWAAE